MVIDQLMRPVGTPQNAKPAKPKSYKNSSRRKAQGLYCILWDLWYSEFLVVRSVGKRLPRAYRCNSKVAQL